MSDMFDFVWFIPKVFEIYIVTLFPTNLKSQMVCYTKPAEKQRLPVMWQISECKPTVFYLPYISMHEM